MELVDKGKLKPKSITQIFHGTTTATNSVLEGKGACTGMITNKGFRDIIHIGRHQSLIIIRLCKRSHGRIASCAKTTSENCQRAPNPPTGNELEPLDEDEVLRIAGELKESGVESLAICFLFSYLNPEHERRTKELVRRIMPDAFITTSSEISPQFREFERFTTAALASFVGPKVANYVKNLENSLSQNDITGDLRIMASNGGVITPRMVLQNPALTMMSGLAAGVLGGAWVGEKCDEVKLLPLILEALRQTLVLQ